MKATHVNYVRDQIIGRQKRKNEGKTENVAKIKTRNAAAKKRPKRGTDKKQKKQESMQRKGGLSFLVFFEFSFVFWTASRYPLVPTRFSGRVIFWTMWERKGKHEADQMEGGWRDWSSSQTASEIKGFN